MPSAVQFWRCNGSRAADWLSVPMATTGRAPNSPQRRASTAIAAARHRARVRDMGDDAYGLRGLGFVGYRQTRNGQAAIV